MFVNFFDLILLKPKRIALLGHCMFRFFAFLILLGMIGHAATTASSLILSMGKHTVSTSGLAELYPNLPTLFIPETFEGFAASLFMAGIGVAMVHFGNQWQRVLEM